MKPARLALLAPLLATAAVAHEGHDHGPAAPPAPLSAAAPRAETSTAEVQLVVALQGERLVLFLDRYASNAPIDGAAVEVQAGDDKAVAAPAGEGTYVAPAGALARPGRHALLVTVEAGDVSDLLNLDLEVPAEAADAAPAASAFPSTAAAWTGGTALLLATVAGLAWRLRTRRRP